MGTLVLLLLLIVAAVLGFGLWVVVSIVSAVVQAIFGTSGVLLPLLMILVGIWLVWRAASGSSRHRRRATGRRERAASRALRRRDQVPDSPPSYPEYQYHAGRGGPAQAPAMFSPPPRRELPIDVQVKAAQIQRKADMLLSYADRFPPFSQSLHIVRQTAADYLPRTLEAYLALPGLSDPLVPATGRTALTELRAQLHLLDAKLDDITLDLQQQDLDKMSANRRFLEERFGLGAATDPPALPVSDHAPDARAALHGWQRLQRMQSSAM